MSSFDKEKLQLYIRNEKPRFVEKVKVLEIIDYLPCLTPSDTETIEAKLRNYENRAAVPCLLTCLMRRQNWPEQLISALDACEHTELADDLRRVYYSHDSQGNNRPNAPAARVHACPPPPSPPPPVSIPESVCNNQADVVPPPLAPSEPAAQFSPPPAASAQLSSLAAEDSSNAASDRAPQAPQSPQMQLIHPQAAPPACTESLQHPTTATSPSLLPPVHQEQENSDAELQIVSGNEGDQASGGVSQVSGISSELTSEPSVQPLINRHAFAATLLPHPVQTATSEISPPQSPSPQADFETDESTSTTITPEKCPVQETVPKNDRVAYTVREAEEHSDAIATQITENCQHTASTGTSTLPAGSQNTSFIDEDDVQLSKPGPLVSCVDISNGCQVQPDKKEATFSGTRSRLQISDSVPTTKDSAPTPTPAPPPALLSIEEPYSGNTDCLEISEVAADSELTTQVSVPAVACSGASLVHQAATTLSPPPRQENGVVELLPHNEPEENEFLSSLGYQEVLVHEGHVSELPSIQNQEGQTQSMLENLNVSPSKPVQNNNSESDISTECHSSVSPELPSHNENCQPSESRDAEVLLELKPQEEKPSSSIKHSLTKYLTATGVVIFAMFMAWKLKR